MIILVCIILISTACKAMQPVPTSHLIHQAHIHTQQLINYAQTLKEIRSSLWPYQGLLVLYQYNKERYTQTADLTPLELHHNNIKNMLMAINKTCENACRALSSYELLKLIEHTQNAQSLLNQLRHESAHFKKIIAKRFPHSKM
jgi:mevalonate kinase